MKQHIYIYTNSDSLRRGAFELRLNLILLQKVRRQPQGSDHIYKNHCIHLTLWRRPMATDTNSASLRREAFELRLDLILLRKVHRQPHGSDHIFKNHCIHLTLWRRPTGTDTSFLRQMIPLSHAKSHCMHLFANSVSLWIPGSWLDKTRVFPVF